jgi:hypothetical protein
MQKHMQYAAGKLLADPEVKLIATVNHRDNFHLWAASRVFEWMTDSMDVMHRDEYIPLFNILCGECNRVENDVRYSGTQKRERTWNNHVPTKSPTIRAICDTVYDQMNKA